MEHPSTQDLYTILRCLEGLQTVCTLEDFPSHLVNLLCSLVGSDVSFLSSFADCCNTLEITPAEVRNVRIEPDYFQQNPLVPRYFQTRDGSAYKISDFLSEQEVYRREGLYDKHLKPLDLTDQLAMVIPEQDSKSDNPFNLIPRRFIAPSQASGITEATTFGKLAVGFYRTTRSFTERDRSVLNLIRPHIAQAYCNAQAYTKLQQQLKHLSQAMDDLVSVILAPSGRVRFISPRALQLLNQYFPDSLWGGEQLPDPLHSWVREQIQQQDEASLTQIRKPFRVEQLGQDLSIRLLGHAGTSQLLLILEEHRHQDLSIKSLQLIGLTKRESEVLFWVTQAKTDAEIATTLGIAKKTVNKHLENLFKKLSVNTRVAAVIKALELLRLMEQ